MNISEIISELRIPQASSDRPSCFAFSLHKAGSTLLYNMLHDLAPHAGLAYFGLPNRLISVDVPDHKMPREIGGIFREKGFLYGGFRYFPKLYNIEILDKCKTILLVRHPLDILVSLYFSVIQSHVIPESPLGNMKVEYVKRRKNSSLLDVNEFSVSNAQTVKNEFISYIELFSHENIKIFRYEDVIYAKEDFLNAICAHFDVLVPNEVIVEIAQNHDVIPEAEDTSKHIRQVHPKNYIKHLSRDVIQYLMDYFCQTLEAFGYCPSEKAARALLLDEMERPEHILRRALYSTDAQKIDQLERKVADITAQIESLSKQLKR